MQWWTPFLSWAQVGGFALTAFGVWMFVIQPTEQWLIVFVLSGFCICMTDGQWSRALSPLEKSSLEPVADGGVFWPGYPVFLSAIVFALLLRVSRDGLSTMAAARLAGVLLAASLVLISLRLAADWLRKRRIRNR